MRTEVIAVRAHSRNGQPSVVNSVSDAGDFEWSLSVERWTDDQIARERMKDPSLVVAPPMPIYLVEPVTGTAGPDNETSDVTWGVEAVRAARSRFTGAGVTVAVLDTGIDRDHLAFRDIEIVEKDFTGEGNGDRRGHGTHCAGTIFGRAHPDLADGVRFGVAPGVQRALIGKVIGCNSASTTNVVEGMQWAASLGAHVISMSLGIDFPAYASELAEERGLPVKVATSKALAAYRDTVRMFDRVASLIRAKSRFGRGAVVLAAAGNESLRDTHPGFTIAAGPPAAADDVLAVAAVEQTRVQQKPFKVASFSNVGATVCAPGVNILSARPGGAMGSATGTSMATPHVAGVIALWAEKAMQETGWFRAEDAVHRVVGTAVLTRGLAPEDAGTGIVRAPL
jgi:subtilisin family serine protease